MKKRSFSIIELLVVIVVIGILASIGLNSFNGSKVRARDSRRKVDLQSVKVAMSLFKRDKGVYPKLSAPTNTDFADCISGDSLVNWTSLQSQLANYLTILPTDPRGKCVGEHPWTVSNKGNVYAYEVNSANPIAYSLWAALENTNDADRNGGDVAKEGKYKVLFRATPIWDTYKLGNFNQNYPNLYGVGCRLPTPPAIPEIPESCVETN